MDPGKIQQLASSPPFETIKEQMIMLGGQRFLHSEIIMNKLICGKIFEEKVDAEHCARHGRLPPNQDRD